jgi:hypothetical protein
MRRALLLAALGVAVCLAGALVLQSRMNNCAALPLLADNIVPNAALARTDAAAPLPDGWSSSAPGAQLRGPAIDGQGFDLDGDGRALQLIGSGNTLRFPPIAIHGGRAYCVAVSALTDSEKHSATRVRLVFTWQDAAGSTLGADAGDWQPVALWLPDAPPNGWARLQGAARAPAGAAMLLVRLEPASDDRVDRDAPVVRPTWASTHWAAPLDPHQAGPVALQPWPHNAGAALSFSFDWETAMGGLVHSRSADDPYGDLDPILRAMRMREGVTTTLALFAPHGIRATYFANGYNFLLGNTEQRQFMGNPTFAWARPEAPYAWRTDTWTHTPWFDPDPFTTVQHDPAWYFGDLVPVLQAAGQDIQSHTFSHLYAGFAATEQIRADMSAWNKLAAERQVAPARVLAFPWSGSAGMADADWYALEEAGITAVTRTNRSQRQYQLASLDDLQCRALPGHAAILACPDLYLTPRSAPQALSLIDRAIEQHGVLDLWAHTEEVTSPEQIAAWQQVVTYAAQRQAAGQLWIAPLAEITDWQHALEQVDITILSDSGSAPDTHGDVPLRVRMSNRSNRDLQGLTLQLPFAIGRVMVGGTASASRVEGSWLILDVRAGTTLEVQAWPA